MSAPDLAARIAFALGLAIPLGACASAQTQADGSSTGAGGASGTSGAAGGTTTGSAVAVAVGPDEIPLPTMEPQCPQEPPDDGRVMRRGGCQIHMDCRPPLPAPPEKHFPAPFERCDPGFQSPMGGGFSPKGTLSTRERAPDICCYAIKQLHPAGRPQRDAGEAQIADLVERSDWLAPMQAPAADLADRDVLAADFRRRGLVEHSSVASFSTAVLALLSLGAPASLIEETQRAALDELEHTKLCFALAAALDGRSIGPGAFPPPRVVPPAAAWIESLVVDGCLGEAAGALEAEEAARACEDPAIRAVFERIARDEAAHAELAYRTLAWLLEAHPVSTRRAASAATAHLHDIPVSPIAARALSDVAGPLLGMMLA
ncbi:MAG: hypothetical protein HOV80_34185 [Polyangiaceae bacterium]|nr:hypothetical protein [Polyangiaceae bacterium]